MDYEYRLEYLEKLHPEVIPLTLLKDLKKEFSLHEIAVMTRSAAAQLLGLTDRGHLRPGAVADVAVYQELPNKAEMFAAAELLFKHGERVVNNGQVILRRTGTTQIIKPGFDHRIEREIQTYFNRFYSLSLDHFMINEAGLDSNHRPRFVNHDLLSA
jgi:formylmethanofuran dehydrogenase subunit A